MRKFEVLEVDEHDINQGLQIGDVLAEVKSDGRAYWFINERTKEEFYSIEDPAEKKESLKLLI